jgi:hypothetical protein
MAYICCKTIQFDGSMYFFSISHKKVIPDWDDLWGTIAHMGSSQTGMNMCCHDLKKQHPKFDQLQMHMFLVHCNNGPHNVLHGWHIECGSMWVIPAWDDPHHSQSWPMFVAKQFNLMVQYIFSPFLTKNDPRVG